MELMGVGRDEHGCAIELPGAELEPKGCLLARGGAAPRGAAHQGRQHFGERARARELEAFPGTLRLASRGGVERGERHAARQVSCQGVEDEVLVGTATGVLARWLAELGVIARRRERLGTKLRLPITSRVHKAGRARRERLVLEQSSLERDAARG